MLNQAIKLHGGSGLSTAILLSLAAVCGGCATTQEPAPAEANPHLATASPSASSIIAHVNDKSIPLSAVGGRSRQPGGDPLAVDEAISRELMRQEVLKLDLSKDPAAAERLDNLLRIAYAQFGAERYINEMVISDEEVKQAFDNRHPPHQPGEYKASHILLTSEAEAKTVIAKLQKGGKFETLARKFSKDPGSQKQGGDLGWFEPARLDSAVATAVAALDDGEFTQEPVQSQFGWHVILREGAREKAPADFAKEKEKLRAALKAQKFQQHILEIRKQAKIERLSPSNARAILEPTAAATVDKQDPTTGAIQ